MNPFSSTSRWRPIPSVACLSAIAAVLCVVSACSPSLPEPASVDTKNDQCAHCRMTVADVHFAAQLVAPGEEPKFFDDIGCLRAFLGTQPTLASGTVAYVADHRTKEWIKAVDAIYVRNDALETPMSSHIVAFATAASRDADPAPSGGETLDAAGVFGSTAVPGGGR